MTTAPDDFQNWLSGMDDTLEWFLQLQPPELKKQLDFRPDSLAIVEGMILQKYQDTDSMLKAEESQWVNGCACYLGETFRRKNGSQWTLRRDDPKFAFHGIPILMGGFKQATPLCPLALATATADRRTGKFLRMVFDNLKSNC